jgi:hypothetical protein
MPNGSSPTVLSIIYVFRGRILAKAKLKIFLLPAFVFYGVIVVTLISLKIFDQN